MTQKTNQEAKSRLPDFKNRQEMAAWFDTHDLADYQDELKAVNVKFELERSKDKTLVVRMQEPLRKQLDHVAQSKGLNASSLARMWIIEKLQQAA